MKKKEKKGHQLNAVIFLTYMYSMKQIVSAVFAITLVPSMSFHGHFASFYIAHLIYVNVCSTEGVDECNKNIKSTVFCNLS